MGEGIVTVWVIAAGGAWIFGTDSDAAVCLLIATVCAGCTAFWRWAVDY